MSIPRKIVALACAALFALSAQSPIAGSAIANQPTDRYSTNEVIDAGHHFFGATSGSLASMVEYIVSEFGEPNGYIIGQEASGAFVGGLRYGEGYLYTKNEGNRAVFWQGPSIGWDVGGDGDRTMMLVYDLDRADAIYRRFAGVNGSAYMVGGLGMTVLAHSKRDTQRTMYVVPIRTGVGARLGVNVGYLKFTPRPTWNPF
ncbi:MAG TPA: DUF1134 domain-containing protein [Afifellaceae bacterium]|nr:DUF1134 domain-containing protein [Afifellaceae bacterium]